MNTLRAFFAITLPKPTVDALEKAVYSLKLSTQKHHFRWINSEHWHITLQFLKSIKVEDIPPLIQQVQIQLKEIQSIRLELGELEWFPSPQHPRLLVLKAGPDSLLPPLSASIGQAISHLNYPIESRKFRGHLSIARIQSPQDINQIDLQKLQPPILPSIPVDKIYLIESKPDKGKTNYQPIAQFNIG